jgi:hypothetical protein
MSKTGKVITLDFGMTADGQIAFFVRGDATSEDGNKAIKLLMDALQTENITLSGITEPERHRDDTRIQVVHDLTHLHNH